MHTKAQGFDRVADEGLEKNATTMSQIPTYVTAVPTGTEKVRREADLN
jgi:hexokinase